MTIPLDSNVWVADSGLFIVCGRQENTKYTALEWFATHNQITFIIPQHVYEELTGAPAQSTPGQIPIDNAITSGWATVAEEFDCTNRERNGKADQIDSSVVFSRVRQCGQGEI